MTVSSEISRAGPFYGNGSNTTFPYGFKIFDEEHIRVVLIAVSGDVSELSLEDGDYSVTGVGSEVGGNVIKSTPLLVGQVLTLVRRLPLTQETSLENQGAYYPEVVEQRFDLLTMQIQTVNEAVGRSLTVEPGQAKPSMTQIAAAEGYAQAAQQSRNEAGEFAEDSALSALASAGSATFSGNSATLAQLWANEAENTPVAGGLYSAYHWAAKAAAIVSNAVQSAINAAANKALLHDNDRFPVTDSQASFGLKYATLLNLIDSIFQTTRTIANGQFRSGSFKLFNASGTPRALMFNTTALTADRVITMPDRSVDLSQVETAFGKSQSWTVHTTATRVGGTSYQNTTGRTIFVIIQASTSSNQTIDTSSDGVSWNSISAGVSSTYPGIGFVPVRPGDYYRLSSGVYSKWSELS